MFDSKSGRDICPHSVSIRGLCGNCGVRLDSSQQTNSVSMVHTNPELRVSTEFAEHIGKEDQNKLIELRKLVLLVDLDQTLLHTTHETVRNDPNVHTFTLPPDNRLNYTTKLRPYLHEFLESMSKLFELHIFTFGCQRYARKIASIIDPDGKYFGNRILSRDESVDRFSKLENLSNLFPVGDEMVCIIDDRSDVWRAAGNLIQVKPYVYFQTSISDGAATTAADDNLDEDYDKLNALLGLDGDDASGEDGDDEEEDEAKSSGSSDSQDGSGSGNPRKKAKHSDESKSDDDSTSKEDEPAGDQTTISVDASREVEPESDEPKSEESKEESPPPPSPPIDLDDHLLHLRKILERVHEKWYMELDLERRFLAEGEAYKMPDIKDIIRKYLRKSYK